MASAFLMPVAAQGALLGGSSFANGAESDIASANRQVVWTNETLERGDLRETDWENFCRVENLVVGCSHVGSNHRDAEFITFPYGLVGGCGSFKRAPTSAFVAFRRGERVVVAVKIEPNPIPRGWQTCPGRAHRFLHSAFKPFIRVGNFAEVSRADAIDGVAGRRLADVLDAQLSIELQSISIPTKIAQFVNGDGAVEKSFYCEPWSQITRGNVLSVCQGLRAFRNGTFSGLDAGLSGFRSFACVMQGAYDKEHAAKADPERGGGPESLIFSRFRSTPGYAKVGLMAVLGWLAGALINESGVRAFRSKRQGEILFAAGALCLGLAVCAALAFS